MNILRILLTAGFITASTSSFGASDDEIALISRSRKVYELISQFYLKNDDRLPKNLEELVNFTKSDKSVIASAKPGFKLLTPADKHTKIANPAKTQLAQSLDTTRSGKRTAIFADGHVEWLPSE